MEHARELRGHKGAVNCLHVCQDAVHMMASGSDDSTCRIWDLRTRRVSQCIAQAFAGDPVQSVTFATASQVYVASRNQVYLFDLRNASSLIVTEATTIFDPVADEINHLHLHPMSTKKPWLAVPDDEGDISILNLKSQSMHTLRGQHTNICSSAVFRPRSAGYDLVSGGLDCQVIFWEVKSDGSGGRMRYKMNMQTLESGLGDDTQMWNPPFVYGLAFSPNGKTFAAALGDGSVALIDFGSRSLVRKLRGHNALVNAVHIFTHRSTDYLISTGNDSKICLWQYESPQADPSFVVHHTAGKSNAIAVAGDNIFVADTTPRISVYQLH
ncbi:unnamed protein product [Aphanomyces euteiches]